MKLKNFLSRSLTAACIFASGNFFNAHALATLPNGVAVNTLHSPTEMQQTQAFTDNFDSFNGAIWASGYMWGANDINMGNANPANLSIINDADGSSLCLKSPAENNVGAITSINQFGYGTYTTRMKFTASNGTWPSFWAVNGPTGWEIDGHESLGNDPATYYMTLHDPNDIGQGTYKNPSSLADQWHTYSFIWTASDVTFYFDNQMKYSQAYSKPELVNVTFTMGIMGNGIIWNSNRYDSTTFANSVPALCIDYFSYTPLSASSTITPTATASIMPTITKSVSPSPTSSITPTMTQTATLSPTPSATPTMTQTIALSSTPLLTTTLPTSTRMATTKTFKLTLQPDGIKGMDTFINDALNYGSTNYMGVGENNNKTKYYARSLIKFDLSAVPANATITSATLSLWTYQDLSSNDTNITVYRLKRSFIENQATWSNARTGMPWQSLGASGINDRESTSIGSALIRAGEALNIEKQIPLKPMQLQEMTRGTFVNNGFILITSSELNDRFNYKTSDYSTAAQRPMLTIEYSIP